MSLNSYSDLNQMQLDAMREIGNIGSGNAATALSNMLAKPIDINVPTIQILDYNDVTEKLGGPERDMIGMMVTLDEDVKGMILFLLEREFAHITVNILLGQDISDYSELDEMGQSMLKEIGNIMSASYINAIAMFTNLVIDISPPALTEDMVGSILSVPAIHFANISDSIIFIENSFEVDGRSTDNNILLIPEVDSLDKIIKALGM